MSTSRILSAIGAALIFFGTVVGIANVLPGGVKTALLVTALGGTINIFTERLQGGASDPAVRAQAIVDERK